MASPALSQASTAFESDPPQVEDDQKAVRKAALQRAKEAATSHDILLFLIALRILNALSIRTFFQPDEYYQSLEPAWEIAFGADSGAWITWEWKNQLRSTIHPAIFAAVYWLSDETSKLLRLGPVTRDELFIAAPKVTQAVIAALGDYYTWKLGERVYGKGNNEAWAVLFLTVTSPWQWFCSTRTLSNCLETTLTVAALHQWPWHWTLDVTRDRIVDENGLRSDQSPDQSPDQSQDQAEELAKCVLHNDDDMRKTRSMAYRLCRCLLLAALACVLRPTNVLIWICLSCFMLWKSSASGRLVKLPWTNRNLWIHITSFVHGPATRRERVFLIGEAAVCGTLVLAISAIADRLYYQQWTFPPFRFLYFNLARSLSVHYGRNDWHYYLSQGYPLLLTTFLPFALLGIYQSLFPQEPPSPQNLSTATIKRQLATISLLIPFALSFISHKEVRFIYPLLPPLHILAATPFTSYFLPLLPSPPHQTPPTKTPQKQNQTKRLLLFTLLQTTNLLLALHTTLHHHPAPLTVLSYLRSRSTNNNTTITAAFLTPCHSTPWRSHLLHPHNLKAWALTCEPPLHLSTRQHATYKDEADEFYAHPAQWLAQHLGPPPKSAREQEVRLRAVERVAWDGSAAAAAAASGGVAQGKGGGKQVWTGYLVFFGQLEEEMARVLKGSGYGVCWRGWNGWGGWHEDWRRRGGVVVWCLDEGEKRGWRERQQQDGKRTGWRGWVGWG